MTNIGETIHQIRLSKGLTQQEVYSGIISRSFASRFESGANDIGASKLFAILDNLAISADELRFIHQNYQPSAYDQALWTIRHAYETLNFPALATWIREHRHSPHAYEQLIASYASILMLSYDHRSVGVTTTTQPAFDHLRQAKTWTLQELKLVPVLIPIIASIDGLAALTPLTTRMAANCASYQTAWGDPFHVSNDLLDFYGSLFQTKLNFHDFQSAQNLKTKFTAIDSHQLNWDGRLSQQFWLGIWNLYFGDWQIGNQLLDEVSVLETHHHPRIDNTLFAIRNVRTKQAQTYRQSHQSHKHL
ncbi:MAG: helix-turn-helix domain-containing protein [Lactiplantibacillus plantarum]|uniref:helix-turn-helix domain-containing protein n=1 Tax=Lactiplantibacillus argentoratensis TaxID=271881 RepID=UPI001CE1BFE8|nr:helix-turn-helix transcriptional regulator [Lactiplantibacillus argentoratensis]MCA5597913.1 helix-turn-helix domain-containing protein [Lactiplantibacillus argentoratensis]MDN5944127.1 helix-turn-helix domain-containing protein [Lactiplantibacillus plantarum]MDN5974996.1 helix-turn-helix domain-containing protein [Lactiplantibacillus plantarum]MDN6825088.1 helix-turn-helix domain-containing protein [Lactiplantibacillus plantarum]